MITKCSTTFSQKLFACMSYPFNKNWQEGIWNHNINWAHSACQAFNLISAIGNNSVFKGKQKWNQINEHMKIKDRSTIIWFP